MALLTKELAHSALAKNIRWLIGPAPLVSALDMKGFSLSVLKLNPTFEKALRTDVETIGWQPPVAFGALRTARHSKIHDSVEYTPSENARVKAVVGTAAQTLIDLESRLNALDAKVGDGDTGSTFAEGARDIAKLLKEGELPLNNSAQLLQLIGERLATVMGGSSGVLMSILFTAAGQALRDGKALPEALLAGLAQLRDKDLNAAAKAAKQGAEDTAKMHKAGAGRSSYVNKANLQDVTDPGAVAVAEVFAAVAKQ